MDNVSTLVVRFVGFVKHLYCLDIQVVMDLDTCLARRMRHCSSWFAFLSFEVACLGFIPQNGTVDNFAGFFHSVLFGIVGQEQIPIGTGN